LSDSPIKAVSSPFWYHFDKITPLKKDDFLSFPPDILEDILLIQQGKLWNTTTDSVLYLPELRSELLEGRITDRDGLPREGVTTTLSFPIIPYQIRSSISDNTGKILFDFIGPNENTDAFIQALNVDYPHTIEVTNNWKLTSPPFDYNIPTLDSLQIQEIIEKSVRVQIENAYRNQLIDSLKPANQWHEQFKPYDSYYILDDYNRFPTVRDHFVEYILGARVRKEKFIINHRYYYNNFNEPHLIMVDGVPVRDSIILAYSPYKFKSIGLINNRYYLGATVFDGVLNFETFEGGLKEMRLDDNVLKIPVIGVSASKEYHFPNYSSLNNPRIPDQRDQLYWNPTVTPVEGQTIITFFTSDVKGIHEIIVEGFTSEGKPLSLIKNFEVK
ncbi:MAG: hypothetical protein OEY51_13695, partial [Cyclobacteriaceae bacterium]|nr:hypothetical protein [Cyclobacteriaceae bacterium]